MYASILYRGRLEDAYRLRYQVYVEEKGWEPPNDTGLETDKWDKSSFHLGVYEGDTLKAYMRIVLPVDGELPFCSKVKVEPGFIHNTDAELSRFISRGGGYTTELIKNLVEASHWYNFSLAWVYTYPAVIRGYRPYFNVISESNRREGIRGLYLLRRKEGL